MKKIKVLFAASELKPFAKVGGLGDVMGSLPKALAKVGVEVKIIIPKYEKISTRKWKLSRVPALRDIRVGKERIAVYKGRLPGSEVEAFFVENNKFLSRGPVYFQKTAFAGTKKEIERFKFFSRAVFGLLQNPKFFQPDIIHCHDWHTGLLVQLLEGGAQEARTIYTIHNLANQGIEGTTNWMAEGIKSADMVSTVSPTYAREILTKKYGAGLQGVLKKLAKARKLTGILNGIDYSFWPTQQRTKVIFQKELGLKQDKNLPIFGLVSRLTSQKGINLIIPSVEKFVKKYDAQFVFLGSGASKLEKSLAKLAKENKENVFTMIGFDEEFAHRIYAQSDFFLMPSVFEPSGLGQMISMHYGTAPIVRATGGLKDSVQHRKTGFVFKKESSKDLAKAMKEALAVFDNPVKMKKLIKNCKKQDFSWSKSAKKYKALYRAIR